MNTYLKVIFAVAITILAAGFIYFFIGVAPEANPITWGVNFSQMQAESLKLDWRKAYLALMEDLGVRHIKLLTQWDWVEGKQGEYYYKDIDWQLSQAQSHGVEILYVVGMKTGRWPECHAPSWTSGLSDEQQEQALLQYVQHVVERYKGNKAITAWQVENEPLVRFGECPDWYYHGTDLLEKEVALVKSLDPSRPVIISDSGELSWWFYVSGIGDKISVTMYRKVWMNLFSIGNTHLGFYNTYPFSPIFYYRKAQLIRAWSGKSVIGGELQAEPWAPRLFYDVPLEEQDKTMNLERFIANVEYAKDTGLDQFYFWGAEWWYWMKTQQNQPAIWNEAKKLFHN